MNETSLALQSVLIGVLLLTLTTQTASGGTFMNLLQRKRRASPTESEMLAETMIKYSDFNLDGGLSVRELTVFFEKGLGLDRKMSKLMAIASLLKGDLNKDKKLQYPEVFELMSTYSR